MGFTKNGLRTVGKQFSNDDIKLLKEDWKEHIKKISEYPSENFSGRGIVFTAGSVKYITCAWVSITLLRQSGCELPIELWYLGNEVSDDVIAKFSSLNVMCKNLHDDKEVSLRGYMLKPLSIIKSSFKEVLFLDADNICVKDPSYLFSTPEYLKTGAVFWPDYWLTAKNNPIWKIIGTKTYGLSEQESGQILLDKERCWEALNLCLYFNRLGQYYYRILLGDKDTFKFAWLALDTPFHMIEYAVGTCGYEHEGEFSGNTMVQHDPLGKILFLHRNLLKWDITHHNEEVWKKIKVFKPEAKNKAIILKTTENNLYTIDIEGDIIETDFKAEFDDLETKCLAALIAWRSSETYTRFLAYSHFAKERYRSKKHFEL